MTNEQHNYRVVILVDGKEESVYKFKSYESAVSDFQSSVEEKFGWVPQICHNPTQPPELQESEGEVDVMLQFI